MQRLNCTQTPTHVTRAACAVPHSTPWCDACGSLIPVVDRSNRHRRSSWRPFTGASRLVNLSDTELDVVARNVAALLQQRGILCNADHPCTVFGSSAGTDEQAATRFSGHAATLHGERATESTSEESPPSTIAVRTLTICPAKRLRRIFCAPFASDRTTDYRVKRLAAGCVAPTLPCQSFDLARVDADLERLRHKDEPDTRGSSRAAFYGPADINEVYARIARRAKSLTRLQKAMRAMQPLAAQTHSRCALVGSNHVLRCRHWGARFDGNMYDAVFRVNGFQIDREHVPNQWLDPRHGGERTTYRQSCMTHGRRLNSTRGEICLLTPDFLSNQVSHTDHTQVCGGPRLRSEYTERSIASATDAGFRFALFGRGAPYHSLAVVGSGDSAFVAALTLCRELHVYGVGLFSRVLDRGTIEAVYQHGYDDALARCRPEAIKTKCGGQTSYKPSYVTDLFVREAQYAVWHALGIAKWVFE